MQFGQNIEHEIRAAMKASATPEQIARILRDVWNGMLEHEACGSASRTDNGLPLCFWTSRHQEQRPPWQEFLEAEIEGFPVRPTYCARCQAPRTRYGGDEHARLALEQVDDGPAQLEETGQ